MDKLSRRDAFKLGGVGGCRSTGRGVADSRGALDVVTRSVGLPARREHTNLGPESN